MNNFRRNQARLKRDHHRGKVRAIQPGERLNADLPEPTTICPKQGKRQWTCTHAECICHLKAHEVARME